MEGVPPGARHAPSNRHAVYELADLGVTVIPIESQTGPISSTMGKLLWAIQAWYAEMENSEKSEAIKAGQARARVRKANTWAVLQ